MIKTQIEQSFEQFQFFRQHTMLNSFQLQFPDWPKDGSTTQTFLSSMEKTINIVALVHTYAQATLQHCSCLAYTITQVNNVTPAPTSEAGVQILVKTGTRWIDIMCIHWEFFLALRHTQTHSHTSAAAVSVGSCCCHGVYLRGGAAEMRVEEVNWS